MQVVRVEIDRVRCVGHRIRKFLVVQQHARILCVRLDRERLVLIRHRTGPLECQRRARRIAAKAAGDTEQHVGLLVAGMRLQVRIQLRLGIIVFRLANTVHRRRQRRGRRRCGHAGERERVVVERIDLFAVANRGPVLRGLGDLERCRVVGRVRRLDDLADRERTVFFHEHLNGDDALVRGCRGVRSGLEQFRRYVRFGLCVDRERRGDECERYGQAERELQRVTS